MATIDFRPEQISALQAVRDAGDGGYATQTFTGLEPRAFTLAIINRTRPGLLTGFSKDDDPAGWRVTLTERGRAELEKAELALLEESA